MCVQPGWFTNGLTQKQRTSSCSLNPLCWRCRLSEKMAPNGRTELFCFSFRSLFGTKRWKNREKTPPGRRRRKGGRRGGEGKKQIYVRKKPETTTQNCTATPELDDSPHYTDPGEWRTGAQLSKNSIWSATVTWQRRLGSASNGHMGLPPLRRSFQWEVAGPVTWPRPVLSRGGRPSNPKSDSWWLVRFGFCAPVSLAAFQTTAGIFNRQVTKKNPMIYSLEKENKLKNRPL